MKSMFVFAIVKKRRNQTGGFSLGHSGITVFPCSCKGRKHHKGSGSLAHDTAAAFQTVKRFGRRIRETAIYSRK